MTRHAYHRPLSLKEALALKRAAPGAVFISGGTDLMLELRDRAREKPPVLISLRRVPELTGIEVLETVRIGAGVPVGDVLAHAGLRVLYPALAQALAALGSPQIRNTATIGGNLCRAAPCADSAPPLLVYDARVELAGPTDVRVVPLEDFFRGPGETVIRTDEVLTAILLERPEPGTRGVYLRKGRVAMDLAVVGVAVRLAVRDGLCCGVRVAASSVAPLPLRLTQAEALLEGSRPDPDVLAAAAEAAMEQVRPVTDLRSTAEYRRHLVGVFLKRGVRQLVEETP